jgi:hypothetical protein
MKINLKKIAFVLLMIAPMIGFTQSPDFDFVSNAGDQGEVTSMIIDNQGNSYNVGFFKGNSDFDPSVSTTILSSVGLKDIFVEKMDVNGNLIWAKSVGSVQDDKANGVTIDDSGNVYVTGYFQDSVDFDPGADTLALFSNGGWDAFVLKLDNSGDFVWAKSFGGIGSDEAKAITADPSGNVCLTGAFKETVDFDPSLTGVYDLSTSFANDQQLFTLKLTSTGNFVWAHEFGGPTIRPDIGNDVVSDALGNFYFTGVHSGATDFDPSSGSAVFNAIEGDAFILKLDGTGNYVWAKTLTGSGYAYGEGLDLDDQNNIYATGRFNGVVNFNPPAVANEITTNGDFDAYIIKLTNTGAYAWGEKIGGIYTDAAYGIEVTDDNELLVTGYFDDTVDFDPSAGVFNIGTQGGRDLFALKMDLASNLIWAISIGGSAYQSGSSIGSFGANSVFIAGYYSNTTDFNPDPVDEVNLYSGFGTDGFVLKLNDCETSSTIAYEICEGDTYTSATGLVYAVTGSYNDTISNVLGCDSIITTDLTVSVIDNGVTTSGVTLTANTSNANYQWIDCDLNQMIIGSTSQSFIATSNGNYAVVLTLNNCTDTSACVSISSVGLNDDSQELLVLFPNPVKNILHISGSNVVLNTSILNSLGQVVLESSESDISVSSLENGLYFVYIESDGKVSTFSLIKE